MTVIKDALGEQLVAEGLAGSAYLLSINRTLSVPHGFELPAPWNLPSRLFRFPIEVSQPTKERPRRIGLMHPDLGGHPFVQHVEAVLGIALDRDGAPNEYGHSNTALGLWWHACDLICAGQWRALLETAGYTTPGDVFRAVATGLRYSPDRGTGKRQGHLSIADARTIMDELGASEPDDRAAIIRDLLEPSPCRSDDKAVFWPINGSASSSEDDAWTFILGIEDGWFEYDRSGHLQWSELGRNRHAAGTKQTYVEASGQAAFAF